MKARLYSSWLNNTRRIIFAMLLLAAGCEFGVDKSSIVRPNYDLLVNCDRPDLAQASAIITNALCGTIEVAENPDVFICL